MTKASACDATLKLLQSTDENLIAKRNAICAIKINGTEINPRDCETPVRLRRQLAAVRAALQLN